jgi:pimeloyl-ACP methyl ester carboxylesterase
MGPRRWNRRRPTAWTPGAGEERRGALTVRTLGSTGSPILLMHGLGTSGRVWGGGYDALAVGHRVVVPDLPGFGRSPWPPSRCRVDDHADAVARCLAELGLDDEPALVVAHSFGALVGLRLARRRPDLVSGLVVFGPPIAPDLPALRRALAGTARGTSWVRTRSRWAELAAEIPGWLGEVAVPVQMVVGTRDALSDLPHARTLEARYPHVEVVAWPHAGHDVPLAYPAACRVRIEELVATDYRASTRRVTLGPGRRSLV